MDAVCVRSWFGLAVLTSLPACGGDSRALGNPPDGTGGLPVASGGAVRSSGGAIQGATGGTGNQGGAGAGGTNAGGAANPGGAGGRGAGGPGATGGTGGDGTGGDGDGGEIVSPPPALSRTLSDATAKPGEDVVGLCQSWTLNNDTPLFVNRIVATNEGGLHHSNWIWVPDTSYPGPDETFRCADRGFDQILAGAVGGVFFAQSTQSQKDTQAFPPGVAFEVPPHARIVGDVHLMNTRDQPLTTRVHFDVYTLPPEEVRVKLQPMAFTNLALDIAPATKTSARMQCPTPPDFDVYYALPHFHDLGLGMRIEVAGGSMNGTAIFDSSGVVGESLGRTFTQPISVRGATGLGISCDFQNPRAETIRYGYGNQEMCVALLYTTGAKTGGEALTNLTVTDTGGVHRTEGFCLGISTP